MISKFTKGKPYSKSAQYSNVNPSAKSLGNQSNDGESNHAEGRGNELAGGDHARERIALAKRSLIVVTTVLAIGSALGTILMYAKLNQSENFQMNLISQLNNSQAKLQQAIDVLKEEINSLKSSQVPGASNPSNQNQGSSEGGNNAATTGISTSPTTTRKTTTTPNTPPAILLRSCAQTTGSGVHALADGQQAYCTDGWRVFQRRYDGSLSDFHTKNWVEYADGFGNANGEFWLGLRNLYRITQQGGCRLRADMRDYADQTVYAEYSSFSVGEEVDLFRASISGYSGTAGDCLASPTYAPTQRTINGMAFTTVDSDNDRLSSTNCAEVSKYLKGLGGWWHNICSCAFPNAKYGRVTNNAYGMHWREWKEQESLKEISLKIRCDKP